MPLVIRNHWLGWLTALVAVALYFAVVAKVGAHDDADWVMNQGLHDPQTGAWCCGKGDCQRLTEVGAVREVAGGFWVALTDETIPVSRVLWKSPTGEWWVCLKHEAGAPSVRCLIGPPRGM